MSKDIIKVLHLKQMISNDGATEIILNLYKHINREKIKFDFLVYKEESNQNVKELQNLGSNIHFLPIKSQGIKITRLLKRSVAFYRFLKKNNYNVLHINTDDPFRALELSIAKLAGVKIRIIHSHGIRDYEKKEATPFIKGAIQYLCKIVISKTATDFFACSSSVANWMYTKKILNSSRYKTIRNGIEVEKYKFDKEVRNEYRKKLNISDKFVIGHVGRFTYVKNHEFLIDIFSEVHKQHRESILLLIGQGELQSDVKRQVQELGLSDSVKFLGQRPDVAQLMQSMDVCVFPSYYEGLGLVAIEAQAAGLKTYMSDTIPNEARITNLVEALSLDCDALYWAEKITCVENNYLRNNTSQLVIKSGYDLIQVANELEDFYTSKTYHN